MTDPIMTDPRTQVARDLVAAWDRQQEVYIPGRETRFEVMLDLVERLVPTTDLRVLDLACGPGSLATRVLDRFPQAEVVAVDMDPLLLALGALAGDPAGPRPVWVQADLRDPAWPQRVSGGRFHAVVSTTALHWLTGSQLVGLYAQLHDLLVPGGVFCNGDLLPSDSPSGTIARAVRDVGAARTTAAVAAGADDWDAWWARVRAVPSLAAEVRAHDEALATHHGAPTGGLHVAALREAGFAEVELVWRYLTEGLLCALA